MQQGRCCPRSQGRRGERDGLERQAPGRTQSLLRFLFRRADENGRLKTSRDHGNLPRTPGFPCLGQHDPRGCLGRPLRRSGNVSALERCVAADRQEVSLLEGILMTTLFQDVRYGLRVLWKSPGFTIVAVLSLALGVGANTAIFSIVNTVLLRSLPFSHPERLVKVIASNRGVGARDIGLSVPEFDDLRSRAGVFDKVTAIQGGPTNLTGAERPQRFELLEVSPNYFSMLGTSAHIGRVFGPGDEAPGFAEAAVISDSLWARGFGRDPGVLGRKIQLDNDPYTIVGVLPPGFRHPGSTVSTDVEIWVTCGFRADPFPKPERSLRILPGAAIGLLKPGIGLEQAQSRL